MQASVGVVTILDPATGIDHAVQMAEQVMRRRKARLAPTAS